MAMYFLDGKDLRVNLKNYAEKSERMPVADIVKMAGEVCSALDYAHENGVIHRDIKPSNIMMTSTGAALTDFGLALSTAEGTMGDTFGSAHYIAPEQAISSARAVPQSDLYSLGVVLYEAFTGKVPFDDPSVMSVALKHLNDPPPPPTLFNPDLPSSLEKVLLRVLSKEPKDRYSTGKELTEALQHALTVVDDQDTAEIATATLQKHAQSNRESQDNMAATHVPVPTPPSAPPPASVATTQKHEGSQASGLDKDSGKPTVTVSTLSSSSASSKKEINKLPFILTGIAVLVIILLIGGFLILGGDDGDDGDVAEIEATNTATIVDTPTEEASLEITISQETETLEVTADSPNENATSDGDATEIIEVSADSTDTPEPSSTNTQQPSPTPTDLIEPDTDTPQPTSISTRRPTNTRVPSNTPTPEPTDTVPPTDTLEPSDTPSPEPTETPYQPPDIELRYTTERIILRNISGDRLDLRLLAFEGDENGFFEASTWANSGFGSLSTFRNEGCIQVATDPSNVFDSSQDPNCRWYNYFIWETLPERHFWLDTEENTSFAVLMNGELVADCPVAESPVRNTICEFALPE